MDDRDDEIAILRLRVADLERELKARDMLRRRADGERIRAENAIRAADEPSRYGYRAPPVMAPAVIRDGADMIATLRTVRQRRGWTHLDLDSKIGWADGYASKVEQPHKRFGRPLVAPALSDLMQALGVGLVAVDVGPRTGYAELPLPLAIEPDAGRVEIRPYALHADVLSDVRQSLAEIGILTG